MTGRSRSAPRRRSARLSVGQSELKKKSEQSEERSNEVDGGKPPKVPAAQRAPQKRCSARFRGEQTESSEHSESNDGGVKPIRRSAALRDPKKRAKKVAINNEEEEEDSQPSTSAAVQIDHSSVRERAIPADSSKLNRPTARAVPMEELKRRYPPPAKPPPPPSSARLGTEQLDSAARRKSKGKPPVANGLYARKKNANQRVQESKPRSSEEDESTSDEDGEAGWGEAEHFGIVGPTAAGNQHVLSTAAVEIHIGPKVANEDHEDEVAQAQKWEKQVELAIAKKKRELADSCHKVHLLCYIAHLHYQVGVGMAAGKYLADALKKLVVPELMANADYATLANTPITAKFMEQLICIVRAKLLHVGKGAVPIVSTSATSGKPAEAARRSGMSGQLARLSEILASGCFESDQELAVIFFALCHCVLKLTTRLCLACNPMPRTVASFEVVKAGSNSATQGQRATTTPADQEKQHKEDEGGQNGENDGAIASSTKWPALPPRNYWVEYYDAKRGRWICVDPLYKQVDRPGEISNKAECPMLYVLGVDSQMGVRDLTARYAGKQILSTTSRKARADESWLRETLGMEILKADEKRAHNEDKEILEQLRSLPLPTKVADFKNHPLYVLEKDLLKFEAIYPKDTKPVGRIRTHTIYPRANVYTLQGSLNWIKEARTVKVGEEPYKVVKARPKLNVPKENRVPLTLDVFGIWQTEPYVPPEVKDGTIPRNEYGNIYVYKNSMVPRGCCHIRLPGIHQVARRLDVDSVPAVVGWEFAGAGSHPLIDGCVVLEEDVEALTDAWREANQRKMENESKKVSGRIWKNWRRLIKGKLTLEKVRSRFA